MLKNTTAAKFNLLFSLTSVIIMLLCIVAKKKQAERQQEEYASANEWNQRIISFEMDSPTSTNSA